MDTRSTRVLFIPAAFRSAYVRERDPRVGAADETGNRATDKGGAIVVMNTEDYRQECLRLLGDSTYYAHVDQDLTGPLQTEIRRLIGKETQSALVLLSD
ncbi:hypothetical protein NDU88_006762 [Pleurodeles waltl]|uniref:Uncharacterized protein n=1 Tax=Pleurodeles waltl TaxID=8319 RepID=A0AAV7QKX9_PLEWA|nr:hypothetical protein NDU88_006762 [Pleurodeles waltl]